MLRQPINEFRQSNGRPGLPIDNIQENEYCLWHCKYMASVCCCHTPAEMLYGKAEAVGYRGFFRDYREALRAIIFEDFATSNQGHRELILFSHNLAAAFHEERNCVFVTIRGW